MSEIVRTIIIMSATGSILSILLFILKPLMSNRLPKSAQYYLWLVVIFAMLIPVSQIIVLTDNQTATVPALQRVAAVPAIQVAPIPTISQTITRFVITQGEEQERLQNIAHLSHTNAPAYYVQRQAIISPVARFTTYFVIVYPFVVLIVAVWYVANYLFFSKMYRRRNLLPEEETLEILAELCNGRPPRLYYNQLATTPMIFGFFRPMIILPDKDYSAEQLYAILSHELTHLRRKDIFVKWLTLLATAMHWFNPLVWLVRREIDRNCELSCDEAVIRNLDVDGKRIYGNTLIAASANRPAPRAIASATMCEEKKNLKERLGAIMKSKKHTRIALILSALLVFLTACGALALGVGSGENEPPANEPTVYVPATTTTPQEESIINTTYINITRRNEYLINSFPAYHQMEYLTAHAQAYGIEPDPFWANREYDWGIVIWADVELRGLQVITVNRDFVEDQEIYIPSVAHILYELDVLPPNTAFVINRFVTIGGIIPWEGISFIDPTGQRRYFFISDDRRGDPQDPPYYLHEFVNYGYIHGIQRVIDTFYVDLLDGPLWAARVDIFAPLQRAATPLNWIVEPTLPHERIIDCHCGAFYSQDWFELDRATGQATEIMPAHGGRFTAWVYDPQRNLFGQSTTWLDGYHYLWDGMHPMDEWDNVIRAAHDFHDDSVQFGEQIIERSNRLIVVEQVDSSMVGRYLDPNEPGYGGSGNSTEIGFTLSPEAASGKFSFMYNRRLLLDFNFDEAIQMRNLPHSDNDTAHLFPLISVRIGDRWGLVDRYYNVRLDFLFEHFLIIDENTAFAKYNGAYGILDIRGV